MATNPKADKTDKTAERGKTETAGRVSSAPDSQDLPGFTRVTDQIWHQRMPQPTAAEKTAASQQPTMILLYGWGSAQAKHVAKYAAGFRDLYAHADMVVVLSPLLAGMLSGPEERLRAMQPVVDLVYGEAGAGRAQEQRILAHVMSNGGGMFYTATLDAYKRWALSSSSPSVTCMPHDLVVFDSTPGSDAFLPNLPRWSRAVAVGVAGVLPPWPLVVTQVLCGGVLVLLRVVEAVVLRRDSAATASAKIIRDQTKSAVATPRLYLYSKADEFITWQDITQHMAEARHRLGYDVAEEEFEGSPHVGHMRQHGEQYWGAIARRWTETRPVV